MSEVTKIGRAHLPVVAFDLDSTLCHTGHREHLAPIHRPTKNEDWQAYSMGCVDDEPWEPVCTLLRLMQPNHQIYILSGRDNNAMALTIEWLERYELPVDHIRLRRLEDNPSTNAVYKKRVLKGWLREGLDVVLMVEDYPNVAKVIERELGIPTMLVFPWYMLTHEGAYGTGERPQSDALIAPDSATDVMDIGGREAGAQA